MAVEQLTDTEMRAWQALIHSYHDVLGVLDDELQEEHDLSLADYDVLLRLANAGDAGLRMSEVAERVLMSPSGVTRLVDRLTTKGLVERVADPADGRAKLATLTPAGRRYLRKAAATHLRGIRQHFTGRLNGRQLGQLANALEVITGSHEPH